MVCEADTGEEEATSGYRKANPTQSVRLGFVCETDIGGPAREWISVGKSS